MNPWPVIADDATIELEASRQAFDRGDYDSARRQLIPLARDGHAEALFRLAIIYERGLGVEPDPELAEQLYNGFCPLPDPNESRSE